MIERMQEMGKRVRLKWGDRVKQPSRPIRITQHTPYDPEVFGLPLTPDEKRLRVLFRKAF